MVNWPLMYLGAPITTGVSGFTVMLNAVLSLSGGTLLSVTVTSALFVLLALATGGRQLNNPLLGPMLPGPVERLKVSVRVGNGIGG